MPNVYARRSIEAAILLRSLFASATAEASSLVLFRFTESTHGRPSLYSFLNNNELTTLPSSLFDKLTSLERM